MVVDAGLDVAVAGADGTVVTGVGYAADAPGVKANCWLCSALSWSSIAATAWEETPALFNATMSAADRLK